MSDMTHAERRARGLEVLSRLTGTKDPEKAAQRLEDANGALGSLVIDFCLGDVWSRPGISRRDRSLIVIAILGALNQLDQLKVHVRGGINHGLTPEEIREIFNHMCGYAGFPRALNAMKALKCNFVVPLFSQDATADIAAGQTDAGSTYVQRTAIAASSRSSAKCAP